MALMSRVPGMLTALIARSPVFGGKVKSFAAEKALAVTGVRQVVEIERGIAVVADGFWPAKLGPRGPGNRMGRRSFGRA